MASPQEDTDEEFLEDPIRLIDVEQERLLKEALKIKTDFDGFEAADSDGEVLIEKETKKSLRKFAIILPITFFDHSRNVRLLNKCKPLLIKLVDLRKYPWYYKNVKKLDTNVIVIDDDNETPADTEATTDLEHSTASGIMDMLKKEVAKCKIRPVDVSAYSRFKIVGERVSTEKLKYNVNNNISPKLPDNSIEVLQACTNTLNNKDNIKKQIVSTEKETVSKNDNLKQNEHCSPTSLISANTKIHLSKPPEVSDKKLSYIDFKRNIGLVGLRIPCIDSNKKPDEKIKIINKESKAVSDTNKDQTKHVPTANEAIPHPQATLETDKELHKNSNESNNLPNQYQRSISVKIKDVSLPADVNITGDVQEMVPNLNEKSEQEVKKLSENAVTTDTSKLLNCSKEDKKEGKSRSITKPGNIAVKNNSEGKQKTTKTIQNKTGLFVGRQLKYHPSFVHETQCNKQKSDKTEKIEKSKGIKIIKAKAKTLDGADGCNNNTKDKIGKKSHQKKNRKKKGEFDVALNHNNGLKMVISKHLNSVSNAKEIKQPPLIGTEVKENLSVSSGKLPVSNTHSNKITAKNISSNDNSLPSDKVIKSQNTILRNNHHCPPLVDKVALVPNPTEVPSTKPNPQIHVVTGAPSQISMHIDPSNGKSTVFVHKTKNSAPEHSAINNLVTKNTDIASDNITPPKQGKHSNLPQIIQRKSCSTSVLTNTQHEKSVVGNNELTNNNLKSQANLTKKIHLKQKSGNGPFNENNNTIPQLINDARKKAFDHTTSDNITKNCNPVIIPSGTANKVPVQIATLEGCKIPTVIKQPQMKEPITRPRKIIIRRKTVNTPSRGAGAPAPMYKDSIMTNARRNSLQDCSELTNFNQTPVTFPQRRNTCSANQIQRDTNILSFAKEKQINNMRPPFNSNTSMNILNHNLPASKTGLDMNAPLINNSGVLMQPLPQGQNYINRQGKPQNLIMHRPNQRKEWPAPIPYQELQNGPPRNFVHCSPIYSSGMQNNMNQPVENPLNRQFYGYLNQQCTFVPYSYPPLPLPPPPPPPITDDIYTNPVHFPTSMPNIPQNVQRTATPHAHNSSIIGINNDGAIIRKINIVGTQNHTKDESLNRIPVITNNSDDKPVNSKLEMLEELTKVTMSIPPCSPMNKQEPYGYTTVQNSTFPQTYTSSKLAEPFNSAPIEYNIGYVSVTTPNSSMSGVTVGEKDLSVTSNSLSAKTVAPSSLPKSSNQTASLSNQNSPKEAGSHTGKHAPLSVSPSSDKFKKPTINENFIETRRLLSADSRVRPGPLSKKLKLDSSLEKASTPPSKNLLKQFTGYSPPILPIFTYEKTLEYMSQALAPEEKSVVDGFRRPNETLPPKINQSSGKNKRKFPAEEKQSMDKPVKKISLYEYKKRKDGYEEEETKDVKVKMECKEKPGECGDRKFTSDQDLGYDSDSTTVREC